MRFLSRSFVAMLLTLATPSLLANRACADVVIIPLNIVLDAVDSGWYGDNGFHDSTNEGFLTSINDFPTDDWPHVNLRNFFVFDLSSVNGPITSAALRLENPIGLVNGAPALYELFDVSTPIDVLTSSHMFATDIHDDLGDGALLGSILADGTFSPGFAEFTLNADALSILNASSGLVAFGGRLTVETGETVPQSALFGMTSSSSVRQLILTGPTNAAAVPEPSALLFSAVGAAALGLRRRRAALGQPPATATASVR
ncbi:MAG: PEP-CTERM sorting domain-containing protein [Planctomyces sp.]|nr:PEP-CTERM sorting domain-containing protein [Planctomyces sp.]